MLIEEIRDIVDLTPFIGTPPVAGVRFNPLKITRERFEALFPVPLTPSPFFEGGYRLDGEKAGLGNHPLHKGGGCYFQEPSAMSAVTALGVQNGDRVLDLCAAPGSKATAIAALDPEGIVVCNEIHPARAAALLSNIERMGVANALVTNTDAETLAARLPCFFDRILVDSPCSGEGMFRKYPEILEDWTPELVRACAERSAGILRAAAKMLRTGGRLVYSTCTFNAEENEKTVLSFLGEHTEFHAVKSNVPGAANALFGLDAARIFPGTEGEGHFVCALEKEENAPDLSEKQETFTEKDVPREVTGMLQGVVRFPITLYGNRPNVIQTFGGAVYAVPKDIPVLRGVRVLRAGVQIAYCKGRTFLPAHHLFTAAPPEKFLQTVTADDAAAAAYLRGETLPCGKRGFAAVLWQGLTLGGGKASGGVLKNHLPKGLRTLSR